MERTDRERRGTLIAGAALIVVGLVVLVAQQADLGIGWPAWIIIPGVAVFVVAVAVGEPTGAGFAGLAGIITSVGLILAVQEATGTYASWAYAWALVAPGGVGAGLLLYGILMGRWDTARGGLGALITGVAIFLVGYLFFEGLLGLDGRPAGDLARLAVPAAIVGLGVLVILAAFLPWGSTRRGRDRGGEMGTGWAPPAAATSAAATSSAPPAGPAAGAGPAGAVAGGDGGGPVASDARSIDLAGVPSAEVVIGFGAGRLAIVGPAALGHLLDGTFTGGVDREDRGPGAVKLTTPPEAFWGRMWSGRAPFEWRVGLTAEVPLRLGLELGAARTDADLSALRVTDLRVKSGAAETEVVLPGSAGHTRVEIEAGAAAVRLRVPAGVAARIRSSVALGSTDVDQGRFPRDPLGGWVSPDYGSAADRVDIEVRGGVGSVAIR
jgi:hypothetical protein